MPTLFSRFVPEIERGRVVSSRGGLGIIVKRSRDRVVLVAIRACPGNNHRADVHPSLWDACLLKLKAHDAIRCRPFVLAASELYLTNMIAPAPLMRRIDKAVTKELQTQAEEDAFHRKTWRRT